MSINRRQFLRNGALLGGGLIIGFELSGCSEKPKLAAALPDSFQPSSFLEISPSGEFFLQLTHAEMGQGVYTSAATLVAEELEVDPAAITVVFAPVHPALGYQFTGGSNALRKSYAPLRQVGADARAALIAAAAREWQVPADTLVAADGKVRDTRSQREAAYAALVATARTLPIPRQTPLKPADQFKRIGKFDQRLDARQKCDGSAVFGIDIHRDDMRYAVLVRCPHFGGELRHFDAGASARMAGVSEVFALDQRAVAIVADSYWSARQAARALQVEWSKGPLAGLASAAIRALLQQKLDGEEGHSAALAGRPAGGEPVTLAAEYYAPYQAHAPMEPLNCVAAAGADRVDIWCGNQSPDLFRQAVADALRRPRDTVFVHSQFIGGSFGRRMYPDFAIEAALISQKIGRPVQLIWSREDDIRHDRYRPVALSRFRAQLHDGRLVGWENRMAGPSDRQESMPPIVGAIAARLPDRATRAIKNLVAEHQFTATDGATELLYATPYLKVDFVPCDPGIPFGAWRSVGNSLNGFFVECFVDEIAHALAQDPLAFRLAQLKPEATRARAVLELAAAKAQWGSAPAGRFQGIAVFECFGTVVAEVAEISLADQAITVHRVTCAVDCGRAVNPDIVRAQIESGVIFALSATLKGAITIADGAVAQSNFHDFEPIRMRDAPAVDVHIVDSDAAPTGIGEPGVPPLAAAVANAVFAATGRRLRELPLRL